MAEDRPRPYLALLRSQVRAQTTYRASFWLDFFANFIMLGADVSAMLVMFRVTDTLGGFTRDQVLVMFGLGVLAFNLGDLAVGNIERVRAYIRFGTLDTVMVRPLGVLGQLLALDFGLRRVGRVVYATAVLAVALGMADIHWTPQRVVLAIITPFTGAMFFASVFISTSTVAFWWIESGELANTITYGGRDFTSYPMSVYGGLFRRVFAYGIGFAFVAYQPGLVILGLPDPLGLPAWTGWLSPAVALVAAGLAALIWRTGVRHYRSTGS